MLKVNQEYIRSASMDDAFREEPPFRLQGSYRNMNKIAEKLVSAMNAEELEALIKDHFKAEAQTLTTGAEQNLLKLGELRGFMSDDERERWEAIKEVFRRTQRTGGKDSDPVTRVTGTLSMLGDQLGGIRESLMEAASLAKASVDSAAGSHGDDRAEAQSEALRELVGQLETSVDKLSQPQLAVTVNSNMPAAVGEMLTKQLDLINQTLLPLARAAAHNLQEGRDLHQLLVQLVARTGSARQAVSPSAARPALSAKPPAPAKSTAKPGVSQGRPTQRNVGRSQRDTPRLQRTEAPDESES